MKLRDRARSTLDDMSNASTQVIETTSWATVALIAVAAVSVLALSIGLVALGKTNA